VMLAKLRRGEAVIRCHSFVFSTEQRRYRESPSQFEHDQPAASPSIQINERSILLPQRLT
jgi:hypothetical protein